MKLIGLAALARRQRMSRHTLLTHLRALEETTPHLRGLILVHVGKHKKIWVNAVVVEHLRDIATRELRRDVERLKVHDRQQDARLDNLEARLHVA